MAAFQGFGWLKHQSQRFSEAFWRQVPEALFLPGLHISDPECIDVGALPIPDDLLARIVAASSTRGLDIAILPEACLTKDVSLPRAAEPSATAAVSLQLRQTLPNGGKGLVWRAVRKATSRDHVIFAACILKQRQIDALQEALISAGAKISSIYIKGSVGGPLWSDLKQSSRIRRVGLIATAIVALVPASLTSALYSRNLSAVSGDLQTTEERVTQLKEQLLTDRGAEGEAAARNEERANAIRSFNSQSWRLRILSDLTASLPDAVWISELTIAEERVSLAGFSAIEISEVLLALQSIAWAKNTQLAGPVSVDAEAGESRFQVSIDLKDVDLDQ